MKAHCNECGGEREHVSLFEHAESGTGELDEGRNYHWNTRAWMMRCAGCGSLAFKTENWNSEITDDNDIPIKNLKYYPPLIFRQRPSWLKFSLFTGCPPEIDQLINEAYVCMQNSCKRAAAMSIRAALEQIMIHKIGDQGSFTKNLHAFQAQGYIAAKQREIIEPVLEAGHASIHRGYMPSNKDLLLLFDVTETLVEFVFIHGRGAAELKKRIPARK